MKRGQVTIFIIVGIILVFSVVSVFILRDVIDTPKAPVFSDEVYSVVQSCLEDTTDTAISFILLQGGTYEAGNLDSFQVHKLAIPIEKRDGIKAIEENEEYEFTKENLGTSIEIFFEEVFDTCIDDIDFNKFDEEITLDEFSIKTDVRNSYIIMNLDFPITINKGNVALRLDEFSYKREASIREMEEIVNQIVDGSVNNNFPPYEVVDELEEEYNLNISTEFVFDELSIENMIYLIKFKNNDKDEAVAFAIHYDWYDYE